MATYKGGKIATTEQVAQYFEVSTETVQKIAVRNKEELESDGLNILRGKDLKDVVDMLSTTSKAPSLTIWTPRAALRCSMLLRDSAVAKQVRTLLLDIVEQKESVSNLERQFLPEVSIKSIDEAATVLGKRFGIGYEQRILLANIAKYHPQFELPALEPSEVASLPTAKALLTPSQVAEHLGLFCKSNASSPDARAVNKLLEKLEYQTKISGIWSATNKAIDLDLCDRKPVQTGSRSQRDQLLWSSDIVSVLQEHVISA